MDDDAPGATQGRTPGYEQRRGPGVVCFAWPKRGDATLVIEAMGLPYNVRSRVTII